MRVTREIPDSYRYIALGIAAGLASGIVAAFLGMYLPYIAIPVVGFAGFLAGISKPKGTNKGEPENGHGRISRSKPKEAKKLKRSEGKSEKGYSDKE